MTTKELMYMVNHKVKLLSYLLLQLFVSFSIPWLNQLIIDKVLIDRQSSLLFNISIIYVIFAFSSAFLHVELPKLTIRIKEEIKQKLRIKLLETVVKDEGNEYSNSDKGNILTLFESDVNQISQFLTGGLKDTIVQLTSLVVTIGVLLSVNWWIGLLSIMVIPCYLLIPIFFKNRLIVTYKRVQNKRSNRNALVQEILNGLVQIRIFNKQTTFLNRLMDTSNDVIEQRVKEVTLQRLASATIIIYWIVMLCVLWIGGLQVLNGELTIGILLVLINYVDRIEWPVARLTECYSEYQQFLVSKNRWNGIIARAPKKNRGKGIVIESIETVTFENLSFAYSELRKKVFEDLSIDFKKEEVIGVIGKSGMGKSTFLKLLFGFQKPTDGMIYVNGIRLTDVELFSYRKKIGYLSQVSYLFEMSLLDNILLGSSSGVTIEDVYLAAQQAGIHSFIKTLQNGYQSIYGQSGIYLSEGQKQRISLARIFLMNPDLIVLDEPTTNLDKENTKKIIEMIKKKYGKGKLVLLITHDAESLSGFSRILTIDGGRIEITKQEN